MHPTRPNVCFVQNVDYFEVFILQHYVHLFRVLVGFKVRHTETTVPYSDVLTSAWERIWHVAGAITAYAVVKI